MSEQIKLDKRVLQQEVGLLQELANAKAIIVGLIEQLEKLETELNKTKEELKLATTEVVVNGTV